MLRVEYTIPSPPLAIPGPTSRRWGEVPHLVMPKPPHLSFPSPPHHCRRESFLSEPWAKWKKKGTERAVFVYMCVYIYIYIYMCVCVCVYVYMAKEKKTYCIEQLFCVRRRKKKPIPIEQYLCVQRRKKKTNQVPRRPGQPARHPAALRCDGPCRRGQQIYTALPRQGVWAPTTTFALVRR